MSNGGHEETTLIQERVTISERRIPPYNGDSRNCDVNVTTLLISVWLLWLACQHSTEFQIRGVFGQTVFLSSPLPLSHVHVPIIKRSGSQD